MRCSGWFHLQTTGLYVILLHAPTVLWLLLFSALHSLAMGFSLEQNVKKSCLLPTNSHHFWANGGTFYFNWPWSHIHFCCSPAHNWMMLLQKKSKNICWEIFLRPLLELLLFCQISTIKSVTTFLPTQAGVKTAECFFWGDVLAVYRQR